MDAGQTVASRQRVLARLLMAHEMWFDVERDVEVEGRRFPGYAEYHSHGEQYVLVKRAKLWEADEHELIFFDEKSVLDEETLREYARFMTGPALALVDVRPNHMVTNLSLVIVADRVTDEAAKSLRRFRFRKSFRLGLRGWADVRLAVIDLSQVEGNRVSTNAAGKALRATLEANAR